MYRKQELWQKLRALKGEKIWSLTGVSSHTIVRFDDARDEYTIQYTKSEKEVPVRLVDVYALYRELYRIGRLTNRHVERSCKRLLGWARWNAPGSAIFAGLQAKLEPIRQPVNGRRG